MILEFLFPVQLTGEMPDKELIGEGPIFLSVKEVRGEPLIGELKETIQKMRNKNVIRLDIPI